MARIQLKGLFQRLESSALITVFTPAHPQHVIKFGTWHFGGKTPAIFHDIEGRSRLVEFPLLAEEYTVGIAYVLVVRLEAHLAECEGCSGYLEDMRRLVGSLQAAPERGEYEFQMLFGVRPDEQRRLVAEGERVRVYVPYGEDWWAYLVRRLAEKPANLALFLRAVASTS